MRFPILLGGILLLASCQKNESTTSTAVDQTVLARIFGSNIQLNNLDEYAAQSKPAYINRDNTAGNNITNAKATLGRVLFYDKNLSVDRSISCASCHQQTVAFSDISRASSGIEGGTTGRHSMRLINSRFAQESRFFWDERAATLEIQTTQPIQDHAEMGFSGTNGRPNLGELLRRMYGLDYYQNLFQFVYGDRVVTEQRIQESLAQFIRSIQSFDSKYDAGRVAVPNDAAPFANFTAQENQGKQLYLAPPIFDANGIRTGGGAGCQGCHRAPEFDIDPNSRNNGVVAQIGGMGPDLTNTRSPSLRDLIRANGSVNGPMMHNGAFPTLESVIEHYNRIPNNNNQLDPRLRPNGNPQQLNLTQAEKDALVAFLKTLSGTDVYTNRKWGNPFL